MFNSSWFRARAEVVTTMTTAGVDAPAAVPEMEHDVVWVIYASETGVAEHLAHDTCHVLQDAGVASRLLPFDELDLGKLQAIGHALLLVSTCYDGDPPDMAEEFCREHMSEPTRLPQLRYGMVALGDSYYDEFCGFGRQLHQWLQASGAQPLFDPVEMDDEDEAAARRWHDHLHIVIQRRLADRRPAA